jgi:N-acetylglucosaminyldiphosphoundecaprenol N-acetyl-beta-D-mannosaminyltransferase
MDKVTCQILNVFVDVTNRYEATKRIFQFLNDKMGKYVCVFNVHMCMEAFDDSEFCNVVNNADMVVPDGKPIVWVQHLRGEKSASQVRGSDLMLSVCNQAEKDCIAIGLYGGTPNSLTGLIKFLTNQYPGLKITFASSPPFRGLMEKEKKQYIDTINKSTAKILFVGIGCPKQEKWMAEHKTNLDCVMIGVGAAFDFLSGQKKRTPLWIQNLGFEWLFRLSTEPRRLWKRYLKHNTRFIYYLLKQIAT